MRKAFLKLTEFMKRSIPLAVSTPAAGLAALLMLPLAGCGESQQDLFLKHAKRDRGDAAVQTTQPEVPAAAPETAAGQPSETKVTVKQTSVQPPPPGTPPSETMAQAKPAAADDTEAAADNLAEQVGIEPISQRRPAEEWSVAKRRKRAYDNLQAINEALMEYLRAKGTYPRRYLTNAGGVPTLSWRVELLPFLGYQELYDKFDKTRAWNMPPNKELLQYIPDEFVSPERFDEKTNFLVPADSAFMFGQNRPLTPSMIDDGAENTIMLLEVNDSFAVNWTEPKDLDPKSAMKMSGYLGELREDGTFALWASGFPVLLGKQLTNVELFRAMTHAKADGPRAGDIHRPITIEQAEADPVGEESIAQDSMPGDRPEQPAESPAGAPPVDPNDDQIAKRAPVPPVKELTAAQEKLREIYREKLALAKTEPYKSKLAAEMIDTAAELKADPAGAYVLQRAALTLAVEAADAGLLLKGIDQRIARFEVDSFQENLKWIQAFGEATASRDAALVRGGPIVQRAIPVIYTGIQADEYMAASAVARIANRFTDNQIGGQLSRLLTRLRSQLGSAKREYEKSVEFLEQYRVDPQDKAAGAAFGRFLCFIKGDWETGLPLIAEGPNGDLTEVARMDLRGARTAAEQVAVADAWWELSERGNGIYRQGAQDRAVLWYQQAFERLPESLDRLHVKNRLQEAGQTDGRSPIALCQQLAEGLRVDLNQSLTSIAVKGNRASPRFPVEED